MVSCVRRGDDDDRRGAYQLHRVQDDRRYEERIQGDARAPKRDDVQALCAEDMGESRHDSVEEEAEEEKMIEITNTDVFGWDAALRGMRNPMNSWASGATSASGSIRSRTRS